MLAEQVAEKIKNAKSYMELFKTYKRFLKSLHNTDEYIIAHMSEYEEHPWRLLTVHSHVMNSKSARCKKMVELTNDIFKETGLPRCPKGKFRGMDGVDFEKLMINSD